MDIKIDANDYFGNHENDGNLLSLNERIGEIAKLGFPIEFTDLGITVNNEEELCKIITEHFNKKGGNAK